MSDDRNDDDNKVGYCNPPKHTRFKKGQSGNPRGRPKRSQNLSTVFKGVLKETVIIKEGNKVRRVPKLEAVYHRLMNDALQGDPRAINTLLKMAKELDLLRPEEQKSTRGVLVVPKELTIEEWLEKHGPEQAKYRGEEDDDDDNDH